jgi:hypothetical protein
VSFNSSISTLPGQPASTSTHKLRVVNPEQVGSTELNPGEQNGSIDNGKPGETVFRLMTPRLAHEFRWLGFRAIDHYRESGGRKDFDDRRSVIVAYQSPHDATAAHIAAEQALSQYHAERAGVLDLVETLGFRGHPETFPEWYDDAVATGKFEDSADLLLAAESRTKWIAKLSQIETNQAIAPRPEIQISTDEHRVIDQAILALTAESNLFQRAGSLVSILEECKPRPKAKITRPPGCLRITPLPEPQIRRLLSLHADWLKPGSIKDGEASIVPSHPPTFAVKGVATMGSWEGIAPLEGIVETPTLRPDGSLLDQPGYDADTGLWFAPSGTFPAIPDNPTLDDARRAMGSLFNVVDDFPFAEPWYAATWLAALLTSLARFAIDGCVPLFLFDANCPGTGKSKLSDIIAILTTGREMPRGSYPDDQDEMAKLLLSAAMGGDRLLLFDNVATGFSIGGSALDRTVTARTVRGRILGRSEMTSDLPMNVVFFVTGNNLGIKGDALRRIVPCRLETTEERPEERSQFSVSQCGCGCRGNLLTHVKINRGELVANALTILRAYIVAGMPDQGLTPMDFPEWSGLVRNAVKWATSHDPCEGRKVMIADDEETNAHRALVAGWADLCKELGRPSLSVAEALSNLDNTLPVHAGLRSVFTAWSRDGSLPSPRAVGKRIAAFKGRPIDGKAFRSETYQGATRWYVKSV